MEPLLVDTQTKSKRKNPGEANLIDLEGHQTTPESSRATHKQEAEEATNKHDRKSNRQTRNKEHTGERTTAYKKNRHRTTHTRSSSHPPKMTGSLCGEASQDTNRKRQQGTRGKRRKAPNEMRRETYMRARENTNKNKSGKNE